jgi:hypothetical protein
MKNLFCGSRQISAFGTKKLGRNHVISLKVNGVDQTFDGDPTTPLM